MNFDYKKTPSSFLAFILSFFPGLGLMYLGAKKRGFQLTLIACFVLAFQEYSNIFTFIYIIATIYSVFDTLEKIRIFKENNQITDVEIFNFQIIGDKRKMIGIALIVIGILSFFKRLISPLFDNYFPGVYPINILDSSTIKAIILILIGYLLLKGKITTILNKDKTNSENNLNNSHHFHNNNDSTSSSSSSTSDSNKEGK